MRRVFVLALMLLCGCAGVRGPFDAGRPMRVDDPSLPIVEQERRGRDRYPNPDELDKIAPPTSVASPLISPYPH